MPTRPGVDPAPALFTCRHFGTTILRHGANGSSGTGSGGRLPLAAASSFASTSVSRTRERAPGGSFA
jgi:hypothetical protein